MWRLICKLKEVVMDAQKVEGSHPNTKLSSLAQFLELNQSQLMELYTAKIKFIMCRCKP